jgi:hypothetical protein
MTTQLTIVSQEKDDDTFLDGIDGKLENRRPHKRARCRDGLHLRSRVLNGGLEVSRLDLVGHAGLVTDAGGERTYFFLGDTVFLQSDQEPPDALKRLNSVLPPNAVVRLLGCDTGSSGSGLRLIQAISRALNNREVFGVTTELLPKDFGPQGFLASSEQWLISSNKTQPVPSVNRYTLKPQDKPVANTYEALLPGFEALGRAQPGILPATTLLHQGVQIAFSEDRKTVLVSDKPELEPLLMRWNKPQAAPPLSDLVRAF